MARFSKSRHGEIMNQILTIIRWTIIWNSLSLETCFPYLGRGQFWACAWTWMQILISPASCSSMTAVWRVLLASFAFLGLQLWPLTSARTTWPMQRWSSWLNLCCASPRSTSSRTWATPWIRRSCGWWSRIKMLLLSQSPPLDGRVCWGSCLEQLRRKGLTLMQLSSSTISTPWFRLLVRL